MSETETFESYSKSLEGFKDLVKDVELFKYSTEYENLAKTEIFFETGSLGDTQRIIESFVDFVRNLKTDKRLHNIEDGFTMYSCTLGHIKKMPIHVTFYFIKLNGHYVTFYWPTSQLVYYPMIEDWLTKFFPGIPVKDDNGMMEMCKFCPIVDKATYYGLKKRKNTSN